MWSLNPVGTLHRGRGEETPGALGLKACSGVDEDLGRRCRMEEKKEQDSGRGMVPIPLSKVRIVQPEHILVIFGLHFCLQTMMASWEGLVTADPFSLSDF